MNDGSLYDDKDVLLFRQDQLKLPQSHARNGKYWPTGLEKYQR